MAFKDFAIAVAGPEAERVAAGRRESRTMAALGSYLGKDADPGLQAVYQHDPRAGIRAETLVQGRQDKLRAAVGNMVRYLDQLPPEQKPQGYAALVPQLQKAFPGQPIPPEYGPEVEQALVRVRTLAAGGAQDTASSVQSTYLDAEGNRVAVMRDGSRQILGPADTGMANQSIEVVGSDGRTRRVTFNKRTGQHEDADYQGQQASAPQPASVASPTPQMDSLMPIANAMIKAGIPEAQVEAFLMNAAPALPGVQVGAPTMEPAPAPAIPGNIDLSRRSVVNNPDGSISTISSISIGTDQGEVLIPTISGDGRQLSEQEAIAQYRRTGRHLGIFPTPEAATAAAKQISQQQGQRYAQQAPTTPAGSAFVSRTPEEEAAAVERAKIAEQQRAADEQTRIEAERAAAVAGSKADAERDAALRATAPQTIMKAEQTLNLINQALNHPGRATATGMSGATDPRNYMRGTDARSFQILMDQLGGQAFLEAFQSLKGGGAITQIEGQKATDAIARLNTAQSDEDFVKALRELEGVALSAIEKARRVQAGGSPAEAPSPNRRVVTNPQAKNRYGF